MAATKQQFLSFNENFNPGLQFGTEGVDEKEAKDLLSKSGELALPYSWSVWNHVSAPQASIKEGMALYKEATNKEFDFSSVQKFWNLWNHMPQPSELLEQKRMARELPDGVHTVDAVMIFREGVRPEWEDPVNCKGGHFQYQLKPSLGGGQIDEYWNNLVLGMIGGTIEPACYITGIRLVDKLAARPANCIRIEIWFSNYADTEKVEALRESVEKCMVTKADGSMGEAPKCETKAH